MLGAALATGVLVPVLLAAVWLARATLVLVTVRGESMSPTYRHGERVLVRRGTRGLRPGRVVIFSFPRAGSGILMKRVVALPGAAVPEALRGVVAEPTVPPGHVVVFGDGARSIDSRSWGYLPAGCVLGVVIGRPRQPPAGAATAPH